MTYPEAIAALQSLQMFGMKPGLETTAWLAEQLGRPQDRLRFVHVAGTNGKGSVCAFLESIYREAGWRVGLFTSPHLVSFTERLQIGRQPIAETDVTRWTERVMALVPGCPAPPTFFEAVTAMALGWFAEQGCDVVVWETGLGGRLDATNIVTPLASLITNIELDHQEWLGPTHAAIAREKAGILKPGRPAVTAAQPGRGLEEIVAVAQANGCPLTVLGAPGERSNAPGVGRAGADATDGCATPVRRWTEWDALRAALGDSEPGSEPAGDRRADAPAADPAWPALGLAGAHQRSNAAVALAAVAVLADELPVSADAVRRGLAGAAWAGRMQCVERPGGGRVLLDGAHNPAGVQAFEAAFRAQFPAERPTFIVGLLADKEWRAMAGMLSALASRVLVVPVASRRGLAPAELAAGFRSARPEVSVTTCASLAEALDATRGEPLVVVTGSLYLVGEAMERLGVMPVPALGGRGLNEWGGAGATGRTGGVGAG